ncbi:MAG TPA: hypothetical protein DCS83_04740 [Prevotella sp.]|jgi:hypothetical protein|nr:hypothetical protein [Prevotella sp.]
MKKTNNILTVFALLIVLVITSCSQDNILSTKTSDFENLRFKVNVGNPINTRAASDGKTAWSKGDQIYVSIDGDRDNLCNLVYDGSDWNVNKLTSTVDFKESGKLNGVFADTLKYINSHITTWGDILYTDEGSYKKDGDVVNINLNMNKRPVAKVKINGIPDGFWIENMKEYSSLNISDMTWEDTSSEGKLNKEDEGNQTCTFYGTLAANDGNTTIRLINDKGAYYSKTFTGKSIAAGDYITVQGPEESNDWNAMIPIDGITSKGDVNLMIDGTDKITNHYTLSPIDATQTACEYTSSDNNIVTVDNDGNIKAISRGQATITVKSKESNVSCNINVSVKDLTDFITAKSLGMSGVSINGHIQSNSTFSWYFSNGSPVNVKLISLQLVDGSTGNAGNEMNINVDVNAGSAVSYSTTIGFLGINEPVTCRFKYKYNSKTYVITAVCSN